MGSSLSFFTFMYLSFLLFSFQLTSSRQPLCHDKEHSALLRFKESLFIHHEYYYSDSACSTKTELWNLKGNGDCCSWEGVKCNVDTGYVIKLDLSSSCLYGSINSSSTLFHLVHLQWLSLAYNNFTDSKIPSGIMNLSRLSHLNLSHSYFSGQIPPEMLELSNLESLDLSGFWSFDLLRYELQLQQPGYELQLQQPGYELQFQQPGYGLQLQQPNLKSLVEKLTNLKVLDLSSVNNISSSQLEVLTNLSSLNFLSLQNCNLEGTIPSSLGNLYSLIHLDLSDNNFGGQIPSEMLELSQLEYLDLSWNEDSSLEKTLQLRQPGGLRSLVDKLTNLKWLDLSDVNISSSIPKSLGNLSSLTHLSLKDCQLQGQIPSEMLELSQLEYLDLSYNYDLQPGGLRSLVDKLTNLKWLDLSEVNIYSSIPNSLGNLSSLTYLSLRECKLQGTIPSSLGNLYNLIYLDLSRNNFGGTIPSSIGSLTKLVYLDISYNNLQGTIPSSIGSLTKLNTLTLSYNNLQGTILSSIGSLTKLVYLDISINNLQELTWDFQEQFHLQLVASASLSISTSILTIYGASCLFQLEI
ncbi:hypothetical protein EZV62_020825 [Acer yangbiense]|uniref:Uncharacterized protein n=1 Tax=Acer yangbiense TaxID=1000413 RepID=A0A5C7HFF8_9ROSI|nr:hypothetical protein EZV62_020825 [Acer yangbiense]